MHHIFELIQPEIVKIDQDAIICYWQECETDKRLILIDDIIVSIEIISIQIYSLLCH